MTFNLNKRHLISGLSLLLGAAFLSARDASPLVVHPRLLSFEDSAVPAYVKASKSKISISTDHYKDGKQSLRWKFRKNGVLTINQDVPFEPEDSTGKDTYLSGFVVWVHNEKPLAQPLSFQFLKDGKLCSHFKMGLDFKGWRAAYVCFERDMEGTPEEGMNQIRILAPDAEGELAIDHLLTAAKMDHRHQTADMQVPFVNAAVTNHWLQVLNHSRRTPDIAAEASVSDAQKKGIAVMEERFKDLIYQPSQLTDKRMKTLRKDFGAYGIRYNERGQVSGMPIFFERNGECYERILPGYKKGIFVQAGMELKKYFTLMNRIACAYNDATEAQDRAELEKMFLAMYDHVTDQGINYGSCIGNFTHYGYSFRGYYPALYLMREVLRRSGKLDEASRAMLWYGMTNEVFVKPAEWGMDIDSFNTMTMGRIASILMLEDSPLKVQYLKSFSRWIDNGCRPADGLSGCFKPDGACFHHCNNYPAYAIGGLDGATNMLYLLSKTPFAVSPLAHGTVKKVLLTMRFYCNKQEFPLSMSGRHPDGKGHIIPMQYARMALAGTPDGDQKYDGEMAAAFLRLVQQDATAEDAPEYVPTVSNAVLDKLVKQLADAGMKPEEAPQGNINLGYGCVNVQRRGQWSAVARGHSRYLWAAEHYRGENLFGRYLAHGSLQIFTPGKGGKDVSGRSSGWVEEGFDWGRIPGATAIHLPIDQLKATVLNVDKFSGFEEMLFSDETFAGGISQQGSNGAFGMKLHQHDKYNGTLRARKSYHFLDDVIVCLGSDIENRDAQFPTETTVFQLNLADSTACRYWDAPSAGPNWLMDHLGTGYYMPTPAKPQVHMAQKSISNEGKPTQAHWVSLSVDHGINPTAASYHYAILPMTQETRMKTFSKAPSYKVLQQDSKAHIVHNLAGKTISYVLFEKDTKLPATGIVDHADSECMIMLKEDGKGYILTVANPDLALYTGPADEIYDAAGHRIERSIYSRPWKGNACAEVPVRVSLRGKWNIAPSDKCRIISQSDSETVLEFACREAASIDVALK